jgi:hypothetical protein
MNIYEDPEYEDKINRVTDRMGYLILDLIHMSLQKLATENEIFQDWLEVRLEVQREAPARRAKTEEQDIPF